MPKSEAAALRPETDAELLSPIDASLDVLNDVVQDAVPFTNKSLLYSCAATYAEYVAASPNRAFLEMRACEIRLLPEEQAYFTGYSDPMHWLVVAADDGPDTLVVLPVLAHMAAWAPRLSLRVVREDESAWLLTALVDDADLLESLADADLPLLLTFDDEWQFQEQWGPHPQAIEPFLEQWLAENSDYDQLAEDESTAGQAAYARLSTRLLHEMRLWYNSTLNHACGAELSALLARWHDESDEEA